MRCSEWVGNVNWAWNHIDDIQYFQCCHWLLCSVFFRVFSAHAVWRYAFYNVCTILFPTLCPFSTANCGTNAWVRRCSFGKQPAAFVETWNDDNNFNINWSVFAIFVSVFISSSRRYKCSRETIINNLIHSIVFFSLPSQSRYDFHISKDGAIWVQWSTSVYISNTTPWWTGRIKQVKNETKSHY